MKKYKLFISHSWKYSREYDRLIRLLDRYPGFQYSNYSVPKYDPLVATSDKQLKNKLKKQMAPASCVIFLAGVYATYSRWIDTEIELAKSGFANPKKIIAVKKLGSERSSTVAMYAADETVRWSSKSIVKAIQKLCKD